MDEKFGWTAALLVGMLVMVGALGFMGGMATNDAPDNSDENDEEETQTPVVTDDAPLLTMDEAIHPYGAIAFTVEGGIHDEDPSTTVVYVEIINPIDDTDRQGPWMFFAGSDGRWSGVLPITMPGEWVTSAYAEDAGGQTSDIIYSTAVMPLPDEPAAEFTTSFALNSVNNDWADITGTITHTFPSTCVVYYQPQGQDSLPGQVTASAFSIPVDYNATNHAGEIVADCGLFTVTRTVIQYAIPELYTEEPDADQDGIPDEDDDCDNTPQGEPVYSDGCSDSEIDSDGDGVSDADDQCEGHDDNIDVDNDGIVDGCDSLIDSDGDGVADADDVCEGGDDNLDADTDGIPDACDNDDDNDGVADGPDQCPNTPAGTEVDAAGCPVINWEPQDSWLCQDGQGPWVKDYNSENGYSSNNNGVNSAGGGGSGPWFQCDVSVSIQNGEMVVDSNGIPNHDFLSTMGCCTDEVDLEWHITLSPVNDTSGGHSSTNCPAAQGQWECAPSRGAVAVAVNGVPMFGPEEGPGGDAVALHFDYFDEDRQPIFLGWCTSHSAGNNFHYHYDAQCQFWDAAVGEDMSDYEISKLQSQYHSPIIGWAFDGYPIYGMYGYGEDGNIRALTSSYAIERTEEGGDQGYNGIDDWNYMEGLGDLDQCNGRFGPTPEYPEGIYHYVSTPLSGSPLLVTDQSNNQVAMIGFPYFLMCYHGIADVDGQQSGGGQGGPPGGGGGGGGGPGAGQSDTIYGYGFMPENIDSKPPKAGLSLVPSLMEVAQGLLFFAVIIASSLKLNINRRGSTYAVAS
ncbi:MAG: YHYH protein [Candidatus Thermoplasmatota archaeon]|nr:YHYH protein [Candidatus Thermoplasmatota archaeon]